MITKDFSGAELDTLIALVERGPLFDGDVPSKTGRDTLLKMGFAIKTVVRGQTGYQAATMSGVEAYLRRYNADTIAEAIVNRKNLAFAA